MGMEPNETNLRMCGAERRGEDEIGVFERLTHRDRMHSS